MLNHIEEIEHIEWLKMSSSDIIRKSRISNEQGVVLGLIISSMLSLVLVKLAQIK